MILVIAAPASAADAVTLKSATPWNIDYSDDSCALRRSFAYGKDTIAFELRQFAPGDTFSVVVATRDKGFRSRTPEVRFTPGGTKRKIERPLYVTYANGLKGVQWKDSFYPEDLAEDVPGKEIYIPPFRSEAQQQRTETAVTGLEVTGSFPQTIQLGTGEMHKPMQAMRKCLDELLTHWGIDAAAHRTLTRRALPADQGEWARRIQTNYPSAMLEKSKSGIVHVRLMLDAAGKPTACKIQAKSQDMAFEQTACSGLMKYGRFEPALDAAGKPIASYIATTVIYLVN